MQCQNCQTPAMDTDKICICCGKRLSSGSKGNHIAHRTGMVFFVGMAILLNFAVPYPGSMKFNEVVAHSITIGLFCMVAGLVGMFLGWLVGAFISD
jgi:hypothetical protein